MQKGREIGFTIVLSQKNIVSVSRFEDEIWNQFKARQDLTEKQSQKQQDGFLERLAQFLDKL